MTQVVSYLAKYCMCCGKIATTVYPIKVNGLWVGEVYGCRECRLSENELNSFRPSPKSLSSAVLK